MSKQMWMVRAERGGVLFDQFKELGVVAIGWVRLGDPTGLKSREAFIERIRQVAPHLKERQLVVAASQADRFVNRIAEGDWVVTYDPSRRQYLVGTVTGPAIYDKTKVVQPETGDYWPNIRKVKWVGEVSRDSLSVATRNSLGAISTLFQIPETAAQDIQRALEGRPMPEDRVDEEAEVVEEEELASSAEAKSIEFIKDRLNGLDWDEMQELVAGLLNSLGYKTRISPAGPDRGKDIVASRDGFGFENPRIIVEVKHRTAAMGAQEIRSFLGGRHKDDKGLYVSTGGFTKDARYEADRANIPVTLLDLDDLVKALLEQYEKLDIETQRLIPLKKVYWPV